LIWKVKSFRPHKFTPTTFDYLKTLVFKLETSQFQVLGFPTSEEISFSSSSFKRAWNFDHRWTIKRPRLKYADTS